MKIEERIAAFHNLGIFLEELPEEDFQSLAESVRLQNPWFTEANVRMAVRGVKRLLQVDGLQQWTAEYKFDILPRKIAIVMAGNIPLVGFHDFLSVLISGHTILIKCSSKDSILIKFLANKLTAIEPRFEDNIEYGDQLKGFDAVIATGSDNSARYFDYYFGKYPNIIRKNRTSVAILNGAENDEELTSMGTDVFSYFGLGCRNVSKMFLPEGYSLEKIFRSWESFHDIINHHKYYNNYHYQKSLLLMTGTRFLDNGFVMMEENKKLISPIAIVYYEFYKDREVLNAMLSLINEKIQCVVENSAASNLKSGQAQFPALGDYADQIDTLKFLTQLD